MSEGNPRIRKRVRQPAPPTVEGPVPDAEKPVVRPRVRVRPEPAPAPERDPSAPLADIEDVPFPKRYSQDEAIELAGTTEDPIARHTYRPANLIIHAVYAPDMAPGGDATLGYLWRIDDHYMGWAIQSDGRMKYVGKAPGPYERAKEKLLNAYTPIAAMRAKQKNAPRNY